MPANTTKGFKFTKNEKGVTIWYDGRWILDASVIKQTGKLSISTRRSDKSDSLPYFKTAYHDKWYGHTELELVYPKPVEKKP